MGLGTGVSWCVWSMGPKKETGNGKRETVVRGEAPLRGSWTVRAWTARASVLMGTTLGFWTPVLLPKEL